MIPMYKYISSVYILIEWNDGTECIAVILQLPNWLYCILFDQIMGL